MEVGEEVVVGIDGTGHDQAALIWAMQEAQRRNAQLTVLHAYGVANKRSMAGRLRSPWQRHKARRRAASLLRASVSSAMSVVRTEGLSVEIHGELHEGLPAAVLSRRAAWADLLVLGSHRAVLPGRRLGAVIGSTLKKATVPVAIVPTEHDSSGTSSDRPPLVVVGADGSPPGSAALTWAADAARRRDAELVAFRAWVPVDAVIGPLAGMAGDLFGETTRQTSSALHADLEAVGVTGRNVRAEVAGQLPQAALVDRSAGADLVVVGNNGRSAAGRILHGSVSADVARRSQAPVVVVPAPRAVRRAAAPSAVERTLLTTPSRPRAQ